MPPAKTTAVEQRAEQRKPPLGRRFQKGRSGNPKGRPPNKSCLTALLREELDKASPEDKEGKSYAELIVQSMIRLAIEGNSTALKEIWDRIDGKTTTPMSVETREQPALVVIRFVDPATGELTESLPQS